MTGPRKHRPQSPATLRLAEAGYSQKALADSAGVTIGLVSRWLRGERSGPATLKLAAVVEDSLPAEQASEVLAEVERAQAERLAA